MTHIPEINYSFDDFLDLTEYKCPNIILETKKYMQKANVGTRVLVAAIDPSYAIDVQVYARQFKIKIVEQLTFENINYFLLEK